MKFSLTWRATGKTAGQATGQRAQGREFGNEGTGQTLAGRTEEGRAGVEERSHATRGRPDLLLEELAYELRGCRLARVDLVGRVLGPVALVEDSERLGFGVQKGV